MYSSDSKGRWHLLTAPEDQACNNGGSFPTWEVFDNHIHRDSFPTWVVFDNHIHRKDVESFREDDPNSARSYASNGDDVLVSIRIIAPPVASHLCLYCPKELTLYYGTGIVAVHLDSVLFRIAGASIPISKSWCYYADYFVCKASASGMSICGPLPPCYIEGWGSQGQGDAVLSHMLNAREIGLLCRGEEFAVADLLVLIPSDTDDSMAVEFEMFRYRSSGPQHWEVKRLQIQQDDDMDDHGLRWWTTEKVVSFEGCMCWIDYHRGILFCDVFDDEPQLRYAALPAVVPPKGDPCHPDQYGIANPYVTRSLCVTARSAMVFVNVSRADGEISSKRRLGSGFTMTCWSLRTPLRSTTICWAKDGAMEAEEIWGQYPVIEPVMPFLSPEFPFFNLNEHNIVYALLCERRYGAGRTWVLEIDVKIKKLKSVIPYNEVEECLSSENIFCNNALLPSLFSMYFNAHASSLTSTLGADDNSDGWNTMSTVASSEEKAYDPWNGKQGNNICKKTDSWGAGSAGNQESSWSKPTFSLGDQEPAWRKPRFGDDNNENNRGGSGHGYRGRGRGMTFRDVVSSWNRGNKNDESDGKGSRDSWNRRDFDGGRGRGRDRFGRVDRNQGNNFGSGGGSWGSGRGNGGRCGYRNCSDIERRSFSQGDGWYQSYDWNACKGSEKNQAVKSDARNSWSQNRSSHSILCHPSSNANKSSAWGAPSGRARGRSSWEKSNVDSWNSSGAAAADKFSMGDGSEASFQKKMMVHGTAW